MYVYMYANFQTNDTARTSDCHIFAVMIAIIPQYQDV